MERFTRQTRRFFCRGIDLNSPVDAVKDGYYPILENVRSYLDGTIQPRPGLTDINSVISSLTPAHSVRRLNDPANSTWTRVVGSGVGLAYGQGSFTRAQYNAANIAFSGDPLSLVPYRPDQSPDSWMYVGDSLALYKINQAGTVHKIGISPPTTPPSTNLGTLIYGTLLNFESAVGWTIDGTVLTTAIGTAARVDVATVTTTKVLYDSGGSSGWCSIVLPSANLAVIGVGSLLTVITGGPTFTTLLVHEIYPGSNAIKVANILYDTTGNCTIQPDQPIKEIKPNSVVLLNGTTYVRVNSVVPGDDGSSSFRCDTGATTITAGQTLQVIGSIRVYDSGASMNTAGGDAIGQNSLTTGGGATAGTGWLNKNSSLDLSKVTLAGTGYIRGAMSDDDYIHISFKISDLSLLTQGRILFNCDSEATPTYTKNFYQRFFRPNDLISAVKGTATALQNRDTIIQNRNTDSPIVRQPRREGPRLRDADSESIPREPIAVIPAPTTPDGSGTQTGTGDSQWCELIFRRDDLERVGTDNSRGFADINGFRLELSLTGAVTVQVNSLSVWGTYAPDIGDLGSPYFYRYRYRVKSTGACSNWSPPSLNGLLPMREAITITPTASSAPEVDAIDFQRFGGTAPEWLYIGTRSNASSAYTDTIDDIAARDNAELSEDDVHFMPWVVIDTPKSGTTAASGVSGTVVKDSSTNFNTSWAKGTGIKVGGIDTTIRRVFSTSLLEVDNSIGSQSSVAWEIQEPILIGQPLPSLWGPWAGSSGEGRLFACGSTKNPGTLYISNGNDPDSTQEFLKLEITAPSEPLINGCIFNGRNYVFSTERMFEVYESTPNQFSYSEVPNGKGLWSRWALCVGNRIFFLSKDGIYETFGDSPVSITDKTMFPLFPNEGNLGVATNGFNPPNMVSGQEPKFRLSYYDNYLYFNYVDTSSARRTLVYTAEADPPGWFPDVYTPAITYHYGEEGQGVHSILCCGADATTGRLYQLAGTSDNISAIGGHIRAMALDADDRRADKLWGDFILDLDSNNASITVALGVNNHSSTATLTPGFISSSSRSQRVFDINSGNGIEARNISLDLTWASAAATPKFYIWEPAFIPRPENTYLRLAEWDDLGVPQDKFWQGFYLEADTGGIDRSIQIIKDDGTVADTITINHAFRREKPYSFLAAFTSYMVKVLPTDPNSWKLYNIKFIAQPEPPLVTRWETQQTSFGVDGYWHARELYITLTNTATVTLTITRTDDGATFTYTIPVGTRKKNYIPLGPIKAKAAKFLLTSSQPFRIYKESLSIRVKKWASMGSYLELVNPFGDSGGDGAAPI